MLENSNKSATNKLYSPEEREKTLNEIIEITRNDSRIVSTIIVGSGSIGFRDEYSDIDLCIVLKDNVDIIEAYKDFSKTILNQLDVFKYVEILVENERYLQLFLLNNFLEIDVGFVHLKDLEALRGRWQVAYDTSNKVEKIMQTSWDKRKNWNGRKDKVDIKDTYLEYLEDIWYNIIHAAVGVKRKEFWKALYEIEEIRNMTIELHGLRESLETKRFRCVDKMSQDFLIEIEKTLVGSMDESSLLIAINNASKCFYKEAEYFDSVLGNDYSSSMKRKMDDFMSLFID